MDIQKMVLALLARGFTQKMIAYRVGCSQPTVSDIAKGRVGKKRPSYRVVSGLMALYEEVLTSPTSLKAP
jgi:predicted XRE-type DNA-binding protein